MDRRALLLGPPLHPLTPGVERAYAALEMDRVEAVGWLGIVPLALLVAGLAARTRVRENEAYLTVILLSRVVARLGTVPLVTPQVIEGMFASDLAFLQDLYRRVNQEGTSQAAVTCPACRHEFSVEIGGASPGGS